MQNAPCKMHDAHTLLMTSSKDQLLGDLETLTAALKAAPPSPEMDKAIYQCERLHLAVRSSHNEGTRFAAFTLNKILRDLGAAAPTPVAESMARVRAGLDAMGVELQK
jgi:hypothetical protein